MDFFGSNPFTVFTLISAPAVMTNASAIMSLTTSNRLARAVDRSRQLLAELEQCNPTLTPSDRDHFVSRINMCGQRAVLLVRALGCFQLAHGSLAAATAVALIGAVLGLLDPKIYSHIALVVSLLSLMLAIGALITGASIVFRETRLAFQQLQAEAQYLLGRLSILPPTPPSVG